MTLLPTPLPPGAYNLILADPPWDYKDTRTHASTGAVRSAYKTMTLADIQALPLANLCAPDCVLALWGTWPKLPEVLGTMAAWGFEYTTVGFVWLKLNKTARSAEFTKWDVWSGIGHYTASNTEFVLFGRRGRPLYRPGQLAVKQVVITPHTGVHSRKPPEVRNRLVQLFGQVPRIELFARERVPGWCAWGDEVP